MGASLLLPAQINAGDSLSFTDSVAGYSAADGWVLTYALSAGAIRYQIASSAEGDAHKFAVAATTTGGWVEGRYRWQAFVSKGAERVTVGRGFVEIRPDFVSSATDPRHHVEKVLDALEAVIEGRASQDQQSLSLNGRSLTRMPIEELLKFRDKYKAELRQLKAAERVARGLGSGKKIMVRF